MVKVHVVKVGWNGELLFSPENVKADVGDIVQFQFYPKVRIANRINIRLGHERLTM